MSIEVLEAEVLGAELVRRAKAEALRIAKTEHDLANARLQGLKKTLDAAKQAQADAIDASFEKERQTDLNAALRQDAQAQGII